MSALPRTMGAADRRLLPEGRLAGPMPWVIAIMMFLTVLAAAAGLGLGGAAASLGQDLGGRLTVQILQPNGTDAIYFRAPAAGEYPFLCTFPGHGVTMRGTMRVVP